MMKESCAHDVADTAVTSPRLKGALWTNKVDNSAAVRSNNGGLDEAPTQCTGTEQDSRNMAKAVETLGKTPKD